MRTFRSLLAGALIALGLALAPGVAAGGGAAPSEPCVPGTVWEDPSSGVTYICIYDELYGGSRWDRLPQSTTGNDGWMYRSSTNGCAYGDVGLTKSGGYGAIAIIRHYRWPCQTARERAYQPAGELRARIVIQRYNGGWGTCRDSGYLYSTTTANGWFAGLGMGSLADCGPGTYRAWGFGSFYQGGGWRGGSWLTPTMPFK